MLIKDGIVTGIDRVFELLMIALNDHDKAVESLTQSIRETKQKLHNLEVKMAEVPTAAALELMNNELLAAMDRKCGIDG
jgi:predicted  nucleic acid-binding Zn-ribbon protein